MSIFDRIRWRHIAWGTVVLVLLALLTGCGGTGEYITQPDAAISITETDASGGRSLLVGGAVYRCTVAVTGRLPEGLTLVYAGDRCRVIRER